MEKYKFIHTHVYIWIADGNKKDLYIPSNLKVLFFRVNSAGVEPTTSWAVTKCSIH